MNRKPEDLPVARVRTPLRNRAHGQASYVRIRGLSAPRLIPEAHGPRASARQAGKSCYLRLLRSSSRILCVFVSLWFALKTNHKDTKTRRNHKEELGINLLDAPSR